MANVLLVVPTNRQVLQTHRGGVGHLGLGYIAAYLLKHGHEVKICDMKLHPFSENDFRSLVAEFRPDVVGVTSMTHEIFAAADCCGWAKEVLPETLTLVGGAHPSALPSRTLKEFPEFDIAVKGEGEETVLEILGRMATGRDFDGVLGVTYRSGERIYQNPNRPWITNLDSLPFPAWHLVPGANWPVFAGRGCPFGCTFCQRALGRKVRMRSADNVLAEFDAMEKQLGYRGTWFQDETFCVNRKWADEFLDKLIERNQGKGYVWSWKANSRANLADPERYGKMKEAGCRCLDFGVESGDDQILKRIRKSITRKSAKKAIATAKAAGLETNAYFIIGHPGETQWTALRTIQFAASCGVDDIAVGVMVPYPGTEIWEYARKGEYNYKLESEDWRLYDKYFGDALSIEGLSHRRLEFLQSLAYAWFYVRDLRFVLLMKFLSRFRKEAWYMTRRLLKVG